MKGLFQDIVFNLQMSRDLSQILPDILPYVMDLFYSFGTRNAIEKQLFTTWISNFVLTYPFFSAENNNSNAEEGPPREQHFTLMCSTLPLIAEVARKHTDLLLTNDSENKKIFSNLELGMHKWLLQAGTVAAQKNKKSECLIVNNH